MLVLVRGLVMCVLLFFGGASLDDICAQPFITSNSQ